MTGAAIELCGISKSFAGVLALDDVSLQVRAGECHALVGENGAGKSTLGKILAGIQPPSRGQVLIDGKAVHLRSPQDASDAGIGMVHQELSFCPELSVAENLALGRYPRTGPLLSWRAMRERAVRLLSRLGVSFDVRAPIHSLSTGQEQLVQIAAALDVGGRVLIFDEPTSSLSEADAEHMFAVIEDLTRQGVTMVYVSHRLPEVFRLCNRISVLRDGRLVGTVEANDTTEDQLVQMMIGRELQETTQVQTSGGTGKVLLSVRGLTSPGHFANVAFDLHAGEILGVAGLVGAGRSDVATAIFGLDKRASGKITVHDRPLPLGNVRAAMNSGIALVPEDRKRQGLVLQMSCRENFALPMLTELSRFGFVNRRRERQDAERLFGEVDVRAPGIEAPVQTLSGGNQQKVVLAKWLARQADVLIVDEPTRGVDVGAKQAIHELLLQLARSGKGVLLISSDLPEILQLSTRILVMREGALVGELSHAHATQERLLQMMAGVSV